MSEAFGYFVEIAMSCIWTQFREALQYKSSPKGDCYAIAIISLKYILEHQGKVVY